MRVAAALVAVALAGCATAAAVPSPPAKGPARRVAQPPPSPRVAVEQPAGATPAPTPADPPVEAPSATAPGAPREPGEEGLASYYADSLAGHRTASGERYRPESATCAHRTHPFGTRLTVTAVGSGRSAECRVNDRGPWVAGRVLDVSKSVARELGMIGPGVLRVRMAVVEDAPE